MTNLTKSFAFGLLLILGAGGFCYADAPANLPQSSKVEKVEADVKNANRSADDLPIKIEVDSSAVETNDPELKKGKGCADVKGLEEVQGDTFVDYPEAETLPCEGVECKNLDEAQTEDLKYRDLPTAKTEVGCEE